MTLRMLFIGKKDDPFCEAAAAFTRLHVPEPTIRLARRGDSWPSDVDDWKGDYIISYLSPFIIPSRLLDRAKRAAINFHPGPPEYPGIGCTNFAIYNGETEYGVTCHHMAPRVDSGPIIAVKRFALSDNDSVYSVTQRCYALILALFYEIVATILENPPLPKSDEAWKREPYRRRELEALCRITPDMPAHEVERRVRAVTFPGAPGAYVELHGHRFEFVAGDSTPAEEQPKP